MKQLQLFIVVMVFLLSNNVIARPLATNIEHIVWNKTPINIVLPVGTERRIDFPISIKLQVPASIQDKSKRIQVSESGSVYWLATKPFKSARVNAITDTGYSYILNVEARKKAPDNPIAIIDNRIKTNKNQDDVQSVFNYDYVDMIRFAAQSIYAPERLVKRLPGIHRVQVDTSPVLLVKGGDLITAPMAQWMASTVPSLYVTAIRVTSNSLKRIVLDPRLLRGDFLAASSQHGYVNAVGDDGDTTTWYLVSSQPFNEVAP